MTSESVVSPDMFIFFSFFKYEGKREQWLIEGGGWHLVTCSFSNNINTMRKNNLNKKKFVSIRILCEYFA